MGQGRKAGENRWGWVDELRASRLGAAWLTKALVILLTCVLIAAGWMMVVQQIRRDKAAAMQAAILHTQQRAVAFEQYITRTLESADLVTRHLADKYLGSGSERLRLNGSNPTVIADPVLSGRMFGPVTIVNAQGDLLATSVAAAARPLNVLDHPVFRAQRARRDDNLLISPPTRSRFIPGTYIYLTRRVSKPDGSALGFVAVQLRPEELSNFIRDAAFHPTDLVSVIGLDGITRGRREGDRLSSGEDLRNTLVMRMQVRNPNGTYIGPSALDGMERIFSHRRLKDYPIFVTAGLSTDRVLAEAGRRSTILSLSMAAVTLISALTAALIIIGMNHRQNRARALAIANNRLRQAQRIAKVGDWEHDIGAGLLLWSDQLCEMYEAEPCSDRMPFDSFLAYLDDEGRRTVEQAIELGARTGEPQTYRFKAYLPSGTVADRYVKAVPVRGEDGTVTGFTGTDQDVTSETLLRSLQEQVAYLARVDAMNTMAATLAHELNQPLTAAANYLNGGERLLDRGEAGRDLCRQALAAARRQVLSAGEIIKRVREMLGSQRPVGGPTSIAEVTDETVLLLASTTELRPRLVSREIAPDAAEAWIDRIQLQQVLVNLIRNAWEAAALGSNPAVLVSTRPDESRDEVVVSVTDNGPGISQPLDQLFSPFGSSKEEGLGLGLSICRTIIEYHGGKIWIAATGKLGTTISFSLRARTDGRLPAEAAAPKAAQG